MHAFEAYRPVPGAVAPDWVEWHEALYSQGVLLVRCNPSGPEMLEDGVVSIVLRFDHVLAVRMAEDPYDYPRDWTAIELPRDNEGVLVSQFFRSSASAWALSNSSAEEPVFHHILFAWLDRRIEVLTRTQEPQVQCETHVGFSSQPPSAFTVHANAGA